MRTKRGTITKNSTHVENIIKEYYYQQLVSTSNLDKQIPWEKNQYTKSDTRSIINKLE